MSSILVVAVGSGILRQCLVPFLNLVVLCNACTYVCSHVPGTLPSSIDDVNRISHGLDSGHCFLLFYWVWKAFYGFCAF